MLSHHSFYQKLHLEDEGLERMGTMRNSRKKSIAFLIGLLAINLVRVLWTPVLNWSPGWTIVTLFAVSIFLVPAAAIVFLQGEDANQSAVDAMCTLWQLVAFLMVLPGLMTLVYQLSYATTLPGFLGLLSLLLSMATIAVIVMTVCRFLKKDGEETITGARAVQQMFALMLLAGSAGSLLLIDPELPGFKVSVTLAGAFFHGFKFWQAWNVALVACAFLVLFSERLQKWVTRVQLGLFAILPFLVWPAAQEWFQTTGLEGNGLMTVMALVAVVIGVFLYAVSREVSILSSRASTS